MHTRHGSLTLVLLLCVVADLTVCPPSGFARQAPRQLVEVPANQTVSAARVYKHSYALLVGIDDYANLPKDLWLQYAVNDVTALKAVLVRSYGFEAENVTVLTDKQATRVNIEHALAQLADKRRIKSEDRILIFFAGHGQTVKLPTGGEMGFLIPSDADIDLTDAANAGPYLDTCIQMNTIWNYLESSPARHALLLADACYSGLMTRSRSVETINPQTLAVWSARRALQVVTAGGQGETSSEDPKLGHGAFTFKLLEELKARAAEPGQVFTTTELFGALRTSVANLTGGRQTPQIGNYDTEGEFLFITAQPQTVPSLTPLPHLQQPPIPEIPRTKINEIPRTKINAKDGAEMIWIPAGKFLMGDDEYDNPRHIVDLDGYYIYKTDVTVGMYKKFCQDTLHQMPPEPEFPAGNHFNPNWSKEDHPMVCVTWEDAKAYCDWAGMSLPTEAQWEKAARGTDGRQWPWGNTYDGSLFHHSNREGDARGTMPVGSYPSGASPYGVLDMAGNVNQWCADWYDENYIKSAPNTNPTGPGSGTRRVWRGGSWYVPSISVMFRASLRSGGGPGGGGPDIGFRCASRL